MFEGPATGEGGGEKSGLGTTLLDSSIEVEGCVSSQGLYNVWGGGGGWGLFLLDTITEALCWRCLVGSGSIFLIFLVGGGVG